MREVPEGVKMMMDNYGIEFKEIFDAEINWFVGKLWIIGIPYFDIVKFEGFLESRGYIADDGKQSMSEFVEMKYGERGTELIDELLGMELIK